MTVKSFNLRGTSGTGKTTVARAILEESSAKPETYTGRKVSSYFGHYDDVPIIVLGSYETVCGGCDTIPKVGIVADMLREWRGILENGIVFFEGLMISHMLGTVGKAQMDTGADDNVLAFLDTPLEVCVSRVRQRRRDRGIEETVLPEKTMDNLVKDHRSVARCKNRAIEAGHRVVSVEHNRAIQHTMEHLDQLVSEVRCGL